MSNNLFAFNLSQEIPETEIFPFEDKAEYDADRQVWKGVGSTQLSGSTGTRQMTNYSTAYCCPGGWIVKYMKCGVWCSKTDYKTDSSDTD